MPTLQSARLNPLRSWKPLDSVTRVSALVAGMLCILLPFVGHAAITVSVVDLTSSASLDQLSEGDQISFGLVVENDQTEPIYGLDVRVYFDQSIVRGTQMQTTKQFFSLGSFMGENVGGIVNSSHPEQNPYVDPEQLAVAQQTFFPIRGISLTSADGSGALDIGVDGGLISEGDVHARVSFEVVGSGMTRLVVGGIPSGDPFLGGFNKSGYVTTAGRVEATNIIEIDLVSMPEPSTALLIGMGLAAMSRRLRD